MTVPAGDFCVFREQTFLLLYHGKNKCIIRKLHKNTKMLWNVKAEKMVNLPYSPANEIMLAFI